LSYLLERLPIESLESIRYEMIQSILRNKTLKDWRLRDRWYLIGMDGTGTTGFKHRHCPKCLKRKLNNENHHYYHPVLEAKLVTGNGLSLSIGTEYMENTERREDEEKKQDCELKAFYRLAGEAKKRISAVKHMFTNGRIIRETDCI